MGLLMEAKGAERAPFGGVLQVVKLAAVSREPLPRGNAASGPNNSPLTPGEDVDVLPGPEDC